MAKNYVTQSSNNYFVMIPTNDILSMRIYFIHDGTSEKGPFNIDELKLQPLKKETPIWYEGLEKWINAGEAEEFKEVFNITPPPFSTSKPPFKNLLGPEDCNFSNTDQLKEKKKKVYKVTFIAIGIISIISIIGWLIYQNKTNAQEIKDTTEQIEVQDQKIKDQEFETKRIEDEQKQKELDNQQQEANLQNEKDRVNAANTEKYMGYRNNWQNFISVDHEPYNVNSLGGISNLIITVNNNTDKMVDEVQVIVNYITSGGKIWQKETVSITNIAPNNSKSVTAPSSDRGSSVTQEIISITAKSFHFCYPRGMIDNKNFDPYFCK